MSQPDHDVMVEDAVNFCKKHGFRNIKADLSGLDKPSEYKGRIPDVEAYKNGERYFIEVETCDSISNNDTLEQVIVFSQGDFIFLLAVPYQCVDDAESILAKNKISGYTLWRYYSGIHDFGELI